MKCILSPRSGEIAFADAPDPEPGPGEVLVAVAACGLNFPDLLMVEDRYQIRPPRPFVPGGEFAGIVEAVGEGVTEFSPGDPVCAATGTGGLAEKAVVPAKAVNRMPQGLSFEHAASFLATYRTAYHALKDRGRLKSGESLLVLGASGGVGLAAVEIGRWMGANVIAGVSSPAKAEVALRCGAADALVYPAANPDGAAIRQLSAEIKAKAGGGLDVCLDPVGGGYTEAALRALTYGGRLLVVGFPAGIPSIPLNLPLLKSCEIVGVYLRALREHAPALEAANTASLIAMIAAGELQPFNSARFPLEQAGAAIDLLRQRRATGKIVVTMR